MVGDGGIFVSLPCKFFYEKNQNFIVGTCCFLPVSLATNAFAGEADIKIPDLTQVKFDGLGGVSGVMLMYVGIFLCFVGAFFGLVQYKQTKALPVHRQHGQGLQHDLGNLQNLPVHAGQVPRHPLGADRRLHLYYFKVLEETQLPHVVVILLASILGILGSYGVAWFGIRINTVANSRTAFSALKGNPFATLGIPLRSGMSVGLLLVCVELFFMICILMFLQRTSSARASSASPSANRSAPPCSASAAASSPRSPTSAPT